MASSLAFLGFSGNILWQHFSNCAAAGKGRMVSVQGFCHEVSTERKVWSQAWGPGQTSGGDFAALWDTKELFAFVLFCILGLFNVGFDDLFWD